MNRHYHPEVFHGARMKKNYFEGWYFKQVSKAGDYSISFIPGVSISENDTHAFIQCLYFNADGKLKSYYLRFDYDDFECTDHPFSVRIAGNHFDLERLILDIDQDGIRIRGSIDFYNITPIRRSFMAPNIMGLFSYFPKMECNHAVLSMNHSLNGRLEVNGEKLLFNAGKGYIEKDWGSSFPENYLWLQSNCFEDFSTSFFCSIATIPFVCFKFRGLICNLIVNNEEYRFATYNNSRILDYRYQDGLIIIRLKNRKYSLDIEALSNETEKLVAPDKGLMKTVVKEGLMGEIRIILKDKYGNLIYEDIGYNSGIESL